MIDLRDPGVLGFEEAMSGAILFHESRMLLS
jgi:hypothetical protein